ncbi:hypothetical protein KP509_31G016300 [Ceratopteris richardii]|uniref:Uncharacterized protein n=1 Tax=Ceratopteris richardii TaxID=49495 RepID=A0A8T2QX78_CERRI|nr:hypothetical protein KP509_31G016300 [Ceratopteris richardii]
MENAGRLDSIAPPSQLGQPDAINLAISRSNMSTRPFHGNRHYEQIYDNEKADKAQKASELYNSSDIGRTGDADMGWINDADHHGDDYTAKKFNSNIQIIEIRTNGSSLFKTSGEKSLSFECLQSKSLVTKPCQTEKRTATETKRSSKKEKRSSSSLLTRRKLE